MSRVAVPTPARREPLEPTRWRESGRGFWITLGLLLVVALALRLGFIAATDGYHPRHDDGHYARLACALVVGGQYSTRTPSSTPEGCTEMPRGLNTPTAFRPPAYPFLLAGVLKVGDLIPGGFWTDGRIVNAVLGTLVVALAALIALQVWGRRVALLAAALAAVNPPLILVGGSLLSEPMFVALVLGAVAVALRSRTSRRRVLWAAGAGVLVGLAALTKSTGVVLLLPLLPAVALRPRRPWAAVALVLATAVTIAPWTVRNEVRMHAFIPVSNQLGSWLAGTYNTQARSDFRHPAASQPHVRAFVDLAKRPEVERQRELTRRALAYIADHPDYIAVVLARNTQRMLNLEDSRWWRAQGDSISLPRWSADAGTYGFFAFAALAALGAMTAAARRAPRWLWLVPLVLFASVIVAGSEIRYRAPVEPFLILLAALALRSRLSGESGSRP
jgi:4-amino-4-deoxy-L-arabinose transferase-like glycosyltransferase